MLRPEQTPFHAFHHTVRLFSAVLILFAITVSCSRDSSGVAVVVIDAASGNPIPDSVVTVPGQVLRTDQRGEVALAGSPTELAVRAPGHGRVTIKQPEENADNIVVRLPAVTPRALYLSCCGIANKRLRENALRLIGRTQLNALVIDVKDDRGHIAFRSKIALATQIGAQKMIAVPDMAALIASLHARGIYTIARVVTFKDNLLARAHPEWAVHNRDGGLWLDYDGMAWGDPFRQEVQDYNIDVAEEAARQGFDEIQFDYMRFPDNATVVLSRKSTEQSRIAAITGFLTEAEKRLESYNVFIAADVFGYTLWNKNDTGVGQQLEDLAQHLDYISPMLYPSSFQFGIPGYANPVAHPRETVMLSLLNAQKRTGLSPLHFRPWLQAFNDYAYDHRHFGAQEIAAQIGAAEDFGGDGWMLWNPRNVYSDAGLQKITGQRRRLSSRGTQAAKQVTGERP